MKQTNEKQCVNIDGIFLIEDERLTALAKGLTTERDVDSYPPGTMAQLAAFLISAAPYMEPEKFPLAVAEKYKNMPIKRRLAIAGQFIAAEIDAERFREKLQREAERKADAHRNVGSYAGASTPTHTCVSKFTLGQWVENEFGELGKIETVAFTFDPKPQYSVRYHNGKCAWDREDALSPAEAPAK